jgi:hypothetical protein
MSRGELKAVATELRRMHFSPNHPRGSKPLVITTPNYYDMLDAFIDLAPWTNARHEVIVMAAHEDAVILWANQADMELLNRRTGVFVRDYGLPRQYRVDFFNAQGDAFQPEVETTTSFNVMHNTYCTQSDERAKIVWGRLGWVDPHFMGDDAKYFVRNTTRLRTIADRARKKWKPAANEGSSSW